MEREENDKRRLETESRKDGKSGGESESPKD